MCSCNHQLGLAGQPQHCVQFDLLGLQQCASLPLQGLANPGILRSVAALVIHIRLNSSVHLIRRLCMVIAVFSDAASVAAASAASTTAAVTSTVEVDAVASSASTVAGPPGGTAAGATGDAASTYAAPATTCHDWHIYTRIHAPKASDAFLMNASWSSRSAQLCIHMIWTP
jgi:hypothetical protein